jgi:hypothetical protein
MVNQVTNKLASFTHSSLEDAKAMAFLNRFDTKFVLRSSSVFDFLDNIRENYSVLQVKDIVGQSYETVYFDTPDLLCFNLHHNKRARRFKFRTRQYLSSGEIFNEIKQKQNTGKTIKFRQLRNRPDKKKNDAPPLPLLTDLSDFDTGFASLLHKNGYFYNNLSPSLSVYFTRLTFLNKHFPERMTLDFNLSYGHDGMKLMLYDTAIVELKRERSPERTHVQNYLRSINKNPNGFSKYAIGISLTHANAKKNRFLPKIRNLSFERIAA